MWRGKRHARTLDSADALSRGTRGCLTTLRRKMKDGESRLLSTREAARWFGCAPATAGKALREMAEKGHIRYTPHGLTYEVTMLPPPEIRREAFFTPDERSIFDQSAPASFTPPEAAGMPQSNDSERSIFSRSINTEHETHEESPAPAAQPPIASSETDQPDPLVGTIYEVCKIDPRVATVKQRSQVKATAGLLASVGATPDDVRRAARYFAKHDWRGQKGETPTPALLREIWGQVPRPEVHALAQPRPTDPAPFLTPAQLAAQARAMRGDRAPASAPAWSPWGGRRE